MLGIFLRDGVRNNIVNYLKYNDNSVTTLDYNNLKSQQVYLTVIFGISLMPPYWTLTLQNKSNKFDKKGINYYK